MCLKISISSKKQKADTPNACINLYMLLKSPKITTKGFLRYTQQEETTWKRKQQQQDFANWKVDKHELPRKPEFMAGSKESQESKPNLHSRSSKRFRNRWYQVPLEVSLKVKTPRNG